MPNLGPTELLIILAIVILVFGAGRIGKLGAEMGSGIREFKDALKEDDDVVEIVTEQLGLTGIQRCIDRQTVLYRLPVVFLQPYVLLFRGVLCDCPIKGVK